MNLFNPSIKEKDLYSKKGLIVSSNLRDSHLDSLKFVLISLVIIGHWILPTRYTVSASGALYSIIYAFHMPIFVLLSGYFTNVKDLQKLNKRSFLLLETYLVIMGAQSFLYRDYHPLIIPENSGWYVLSLIFWGYMARSIYKMKSSIQIAISIALALLIFHFSIAGVREQTFSFMRTILYFPIFMSGYVAKQQSINISYKIKNRALSALIISLTIIAICCLIYYSGRTLHIFEFNRDSLNILISATNFSSLKIYGIKILLTGGGSIILLIIIKYHTISDIFCGIWKTLITVLFISRHHSAFSKRLSSPRVHNIPIGSLLNNHSVLPNLQNTVQQTYYQSHFNNII